MSLMASESYLTRSKQFVVINNTQSDISEVCEYEGRQGFLLFINDIHRSLSKITIRLFANDTNRFISDKYFNSLEKSAETELN